MWHDIFKSYADAISIATMQRPLVDRPRPEQRRDAEEGSLLRRESRFVRRPHARAGR
jgi:hypothetical protein